MSSSQQERQTKTERVSRGARNMAVVLLRVAVGDIECAHTKKPERQLSPTLTSLGPGSNVPVTFILGRAQGPDHYRSSSVSVTQSAQWDLSVQPPGFEPAKRRHSALGPSQM